MYTNLWPPARNSLSVIVSKYTTVYVIYGKDIQVEVVTVRPDEADKKFLRKKLRKREVAANKSRLYRQIFSLGIKSLQALEANGK